MFGQDVHHKVLNLEHSFENKQYRRPSDVCHTSFAAEEVSAPIFFAWFLGRNLDVCEVPHGMWGSRNFFVRERRFFHKIYHGSNIYILSISQECRKLYSVLLVNNISLLVFLPQRYVAQPSLFLLYAFYFAISVYRYVKTHMWKFTQL